MALRDGGLECKYSTLKKATGSFDDANRLGQGGFGTVYKVVTFVKSIISLRISKILN